MRTTLIGLALMMLGTALPVVAYHTVNDGVAPLGEGAATLNANDYIVGVTDLEVLCESRGMTDPVNREPLAHGGIGGLCFMSSNVDTRPPCGLGYDGLYHCNQNCQPGIPDPTAPVPVDDCQYGIRDAPANNWFLNGVDGYTLFHLQQTSGQIPDVTLTRNGPIFFLANPGGASGLVAAADAGGACVENRYSDITGSSGGHVGAWVPTMAVFLAPIAMPLAVVLNSLPGDYGHYTTAPTTTYPLLPAKPEYCNSESIPNSLLVNVGGLDVFFVGVIGDSGLYLF